jgi:SAM-dependent methyltransferase
MTATAGSLTTGLRALHRSATNGVSLLRESASPRADGSEARVLEILRACRNVDSLSDEPAAGATNKTERDHLSPERANLIRPLDIPPAARVLHLGAGCGAVTRYLGERAGLVDAVEPVRSRAVCAAERTRDLPSVRVFIGEIADVPRIPTYDLVVVNAVEEVAGDDPESYRTLVADIAARLVDGGSLVMGMGNKLGAKVLAGGTGAGTVGATPSLDRREVIELAARAGLHPQTAVAFPDHRSTRAVFRTDLMPPGTRSLLYRVPNFPSPDWVNPWEPLADERSLWRSFVQAGLAADTGNSFLLLAGKGAPSRLWPADVAGAFYSVGRASAFVTETRIDTSTSSPRLRRRRLSEEPLDGDLHLVVGDHPVLPGEDLLDVLIDVDDERSVALLRKWVAMVDTTIARSPSKRPPLDLVPHNLVVDADGGVHFVDNEWTADFATRDLVITRGALYVGIKLAEGGRPRGVWDGCRTIADAVAAIGAVVGLPPDGSWIDGAIAAEADLQVAVTTWHAGRRQAVADAITCLLGRDVHTPVTLVERLDELREQLRRATDAQLAAANELVGARAVIADQARRLTALECETDVLQDRERRAWAQAELMRRTVSWRLTAPLRPGRRHQGDPRAGRSVAG